MSRCQHWEEWLLFGVGNVLNGAEECVTEQERNQRILQFLKTLRHDAGAGSVTHGLRTRTALDPQHPHDSYHLSVATVPR